MGRRELHHPVEQRRGITCLYSYYNNLVVFRENSVDVLTGDYPNFNVQVVTDQVSCRSAHSIESIPGLGVVFLADDGIYALTGGWTAAPCSAWSSSAGPSAGSWRGSRRAVQLEQWVGTLLESERTTYTYRWMGTTGQGLGWCTTSRSRGGASAQVSRSDAWIETSSPSWSSVTTRVWRQERTARLGCSS